MSLSEIALQLSAGMGRSIGIFVLTLLISLPLGLPVALGRMSKNPLLRNVTKVYISIMRGTPLVLQLIVVYFGPSLLFGLKLQNYRFTAVIIAFAVNYAAYFGEIYRSGLQSIPKGQSEAAKVLGYSKAQTFCHILVPQMVRNVLPSVTNEVITLVKDTSLAYAISYTELFSLAKQIASAQTTIIPLFVAGVFYYVFNLVVAVGMEKLEGRMNGGLAR
ncbi:MAG: amino acid ABC transporter permease [Oscillospiraceae bacterium]